MSQQRRRVARLMKNRPQMRRDADRFIPLALIAHPTGSIDVPQLPPQLCAEPSVSESRHRSASRPPVGGLAHPRRREPLPDRHHLEAPADRLLPLLHVRGADRRREPVTGAHQDRERRRIAEVEPIRLVEAVHQAVDHIEGDGLLSVMVCVWLFLCTPPHAGVAPYDRRHLHCGAARAVSRS